jgi:hypothetical protein
MKPSFIVKNAIGVGRQHGLHPIGNKFMVIYSTKISRLIKKAGQLVYLVPGKNLK